KSKTAATGVVEYLHCAQALTRDGEVQNVGAGPELGCGDGARMAARRNINTAAKSSRAVVEQQCDAVGCVVRDGQVRVRVAVKPCNADIGRTISDGVTHRRKEATVTVVSQDRDRAGVIVCRDKIDETVAVQIRGSDTEWRTAHHDRRTCCVRAAT